MKKVTIIGADGFVGSNLSRNLSKSYSITNADIQSISSGLNIKKCDILDIDSLERIIDNDTDIVVNLSGFSKLSDAVKDPLSVMNLNVLGNLNILEVCRKKKIKKFIYASSAYATNDKGSFYSISKITSEKIVKEYKKHFDLDYLILRLGSIYGEDAYYNNYIYNIVEGAIKDKKIEHNTNGEEWRDYLHVKDAINIINELISDDSYWNGEYLLMGKEKIRRKDLFRMINEISGDNIKITYQEDSKALSYKFAPYSVEKNQCKRISLDSYIDLGDGLSKVIEKVMGKYYEQDTVTLTLSK